MRVEYSAGLVARESSPSRTVFFTSSPATTSSNNMSPNSDLSANHDSPSIFLSPPIRKMSLDFADLSSSSPSTNGNELSSITIPLPAARLIARPHTSRVFCVLQPDTLLAMYAAKGDAKSCDSVILLGTRLLYLVRLSGQKNGFALLPTKSNPNSRPSSSSIAVAKCFPGNLPLFLIFQLPSCGYY